MVTISANWNIRNFLVLIQAETKILQLCKNFKILVKRETPGGIWTLLRPLLDSSFLSFLSDLLKNNEHVRITYTQNNFKSTFGSAYLISKKMKLKLAKQAKKEPRKASFPWDIGLLFVQPIKYALILQNIEIYNRKWNYLNSKLRIFTKKCLRQYGSFS